MNQESRRSRLDTLLTEKINEATEQRKLNQDQIKKLRLAGTGDIKRFFDRVEEKRADFDKVRKDYNTGMAILNELTTLSADYQTGPFGQGSVYEKTLESFTADTGIKPRVYEGTF